MLEEPVNYLFRIALDVNLRVPGLEHATGAVLSALSSFKGEIMATLQELQDKIAEVNQQIEEANAKTDALIVVAQTTKDALVALQNAGGATPEQLAEAIASLQQGVDKLNAQDAETDAAAGSVAP